METIDLGVKFVRGFLPAPTPVPGPDFPGGAQTGDINILLIVGFLLLAISIAGIVLYAVMQKKEIVTAAHVQNKIFRNINASIASKVSAVCLLLISAVLIVFGCLIGNAHADEAYKQINPDKTNIQAVVNEDGTCTFENCTLSNSSLYNNILASIKVDLTDEAKNIEGLRDATVQVLHNDEYIYNDHPNGQYSLPKELTYLSPYSQMQLSFNVEYIDTLTFESMFDKPIFTISLSFNKLYDVVYFGNNQTSGFAPWPEHKVFNSPLMIPDNYGNLEKDGYYFYGWNTEPDGSGIHFDPYDMYFINAPLFLYAQWELAGFPSHDTLNEYSWKELSIVANAISDETIEQTEMDKFVRFAEVGETKELVIPHYEDYNDRLYIRIIDFNHDEKADGTGKAGITFMAANAINKGYRYESDNTTKNWYYSNLRSKMQHGGEIYNLLTDAIGFAPVNVIKQYTKAYEDGAYDSTMEECSDAFFLPSNFEISKKHDFGNEGLGQYKYFANDIWKTISVWHGTSIASVMNSINWNGYLWLQRGGSEWLDDPIETAWNNIPDSYKVDCNGPRYLRERTVPGDGNNRSVCYTYNGSSMYVSGVKSTCCVAPCFCL